MKTITLTILVSLFALLSFGQQIKTYSGEFVDNNYEVHQGNNTVGVASYEYYENEKYERVFHGKFSFKNYPYQIIGTYKNGMKDGLWKVTCNVPYNKYTRQKAYKESTTAFYSNGMLNGTCSYSKTELPSGKVLYSSNASFKNDISIGSYYFFGAGAFYGGDACDNFTLKYNSDSLGKYNGDYSVSYEKNHIKYEDKRKYINGNLSWRLYRNLSNGDILLKYQDDIVTPTNMDKNSDYDSMWDLYIGLDFWLCNNCQYCGCTYNPIYLITKGLAKK